MARKTRIFRGEHVRMRRKFLTVSMVFILLFLTTPSSAVKVKPLPNLTWSLLLSKHVIHGRVDYASMDKDPKQLKQCIREFGKIYRQTYGKWARNHQIAFWINAYNLFTIRAIVENYPPDGGNLLYPKTSIRQIGRVWETTRYRTAGQRVSLNQIEHQTLRLIFKDPRIHFALVPASLGCPPLLSVPYTGEDLDQMLDEQVREFLSDPDRGLRWDSEARKLYLSRIFFWYGKDFGYYYLVHRQFSNLPREERSAMNFIWEYIPDELKKSLTDRPFEITFMDYDWSLNDQADPSER
jgi:hypothetical protein